MFSLSALRSLQLDGWLHCDFRSLNVLARRGVGFPEDVTASRRWSCCGPAGEEPHKLVHRIENGVLDHLPGDRTTCLHWQELEAAVMQPVGGAKSIANEYSTAERDQPTCR